MSNFSLRKTLILSGTLLLGALLAGAAPADEEGSTDSAPEQEQPQTGRSRRPVLAPGQAAPAAPPPSVRPVVRDTRTEEEEKEPSEPPPPLKFADEVDVPATEAEEEAQTARGEEETADPGEVRYLTRRGNLHVDMSVRPGIPRPGEPVEVGWLLQEQLLIPDPYLGDRKPVSGVELVVSVRGPEATRVYELHAGSRPGSFGFTFTPHATGVYTLALARRDGRSGYQAEMQLPVGQPPLASSRTLEVRRFPRPAADTEIKALMQGLAKRWMQLERTAGTPQAADAHAELTRFAEAIRDGAPEQFKGAYSGLVNAIGSIPAEGPRQATLQKMDEVNLQSCLRCHAMGRFEFAQDVSAWPAYTPNPKLTPPSVRDTAGGGRRGPVRPVRQ